MIAEVAKLITELGLKDGLTPGLTKAKTALNEANAASTKASGGVSLLQKTASGAGGAFSTFHSRIGQVLGYTGLAGLGAGLFTVGGLLEKSIGQAAAFGTEVYKLQAVTGLTAEQTSALASAFHHFGIEGDTALRVAAMGEKNLELQGATAQKAAAFFQTYGFNLRDASGHLKDFNTLLLDEADYFNNKAIPAATKDAELAKIFGRNWLALIPILQAGRGAISDAEVEAQKLGLTLTKDNLGALAKLREATRNWSTALGGLELQIGLKLVPAITDLANAATKFLATGGRDQIVGFFGKLVAFGRQAADILTGPVATGIKAIYTGWMAIPSDLRNLVITGFAANKTVKFLFGIDIAGGIGSLIAKLIGSKAIPQTIVAAAPIPVFVTNPGFGGPGGSLTPLAGAGGGAAEGGLLATFLASGALPLAALATVAAGVAALLIFHPGHDPNAVHPGFNETTGQRQGGFDRTAGYGLRGPVPVNDAAVKASILAEGAKQSSWRASSQAALARIGVTSLAGNASMNRIQGAVARSAILQSSKLDRLNQLNGVTAGNTGVIARKRTSVSVTAQVNVASTNTFNVNSLATSLVSTYTRVNVGNQYQGKIVPI